MRVSIGAVKKAREVWPVMAGDGDEHIRGRIRAEVRRNSYPSELAKRKSSSIPITLFGTTARVIVRRTDRRGRGNELTVVAVVVTTEGHEAQIAARTAERRLRRTKAMAEDGAHGA